MDPHPTLTLPLPLRGLDDADTKGFTFDSINRRLPLILDEIVAHNAQMPEGFRAGLAKLRQEIVDDAKLGRLDSHPDNAACAFDGDTHASDTWLSSAWWYCENMFYRRILDLCRAHGWHTDPFASQKRASLEGSADAFDLTVLPLCASMDLAALLMRSLWGNRADLSLHTVEALASHKHGDETDNLLVDNSQAVIDHLASTKSTGSGATVSIILDNCGLELLSDLVLADGLLRTGTAARVVLWTKSFPVFVSDVTRQGDVDSHIEWIAARQGAAADAASALAARLRVALSTGSLEMRHAPFFNSPLPYWSLPAGGELRAQLSACKLVIVKGDANYRRLLGDRHWPHDAPFASVTSYFPAPLLALRTCKSGVVCGLPREAEARASSADPSNWLVSGKYGLIQAMLAPMH